MKLSVFMHEENGLTDMLAGFFEGAGHEVIRHERCLCMQQPDIDLGDITLFHPGDEEDCYDPAARFIQQHKDHHFYILVLQDNTRKYPRIEGIGQHDNVTYLTGDNIRRVQTPSYSMPSHDWIGFLGFLSSG